MSADAKLTVVGAGAVGSSVAYAAMIRGSARHVALYDIAPEKTQAEVLDLAHGTLFTPGTDIIGGSDLAVTEGSDVVVITAGAKQRPGQTRLDLAATNAGILRTLMPQLLEASPEAIFVIVTNPCDPMTAVAQKLSGLPPERIFASGTVLDTSRLRWMIANEARVNTTSVHAYIIGEHGDSEFPVWSSASIGQVPLRDWEIDGRKPFTEQRLAEMTDQVVNAAYKVIEGKGATNYAIGLSGIRIAEAILRDLRSVLPVSSILDDFHGISGLALSVPSIVGRRGVEQPLAIPMGEHEEQQLRDSAQAMRKALASLGF